VRDCSVLLLNTVLQEQVNDWWQWLPDTTHGYSVRGAYRLITTSDDPIITDSAIDVWQKHIPEKVSLFAWRLLRNRLPTKDNLLRRSIISFTECACPVGYDIFESAQHLFLECGYADSVWILVRTWLGVSSVVPNVLQHHFIHFSCMAGMSRSTHLFFKTVWLACVWVLWKERNHRIFKNMASDPSVLIDKVKLQSFLWLRSDKTSFIYTYYDWWKHPLLCMGVHL